MLSVNQKEAIFDLMDNEIERLEDLIGVYDSEEGSEVKQDRIKESQYRIKELQEAKQLLMTPSLASLKALAKVEGEVRKLSSSLIMAFGDAHHSFEYAEERAPRAILRYAGTLTHIADGIEEYVTKHSANVTLSDGEGWTVVGFFEHDVTDDINPTFPTHAEALEYAHGRLIGRITHERNKREIVFTGSRVGEWAVGSMSLPPIDGVEIFAPHDNITPVNQINIQDARKRIEEIENDR